MNLFPFVVLEALLAVSVIVLIVWRQAVARSEDDTLHVLHGTLSEQTTVATKLATLDKWGKTVTVVAVVLGVLVGALYVYQYWMSSAQIPTGA